MQPRKPSGKPNAGAKARQAAEALSREEVDKHQAALLKDVEEISTPGIPGPLVVYGPNAFPVVVDVRDGESTVMVAAATLGKGRLVALPHNGYLGKLLSEHVGTGKLVQNALLWAAGLDPGKATEIRVAVLGNGELVKLLQTSNVPVKALTPRNWTGQLTGANVVVADIYDASREELAALERFVREGGGLVAANLIWGWEQGHPARTRWSITAATGSIRRRGLSGRTVMRRPVMAQRSKSRHHSPTSYTSAGRWMHSMKRRRRSGRWNRPTGRPWSRRSGI